MGRERLGEMAEQKPRPPRFQSPPHSARTPAQHQKARQLRTLSPAVKLRASHGALSESEAQDEVRQLRTQLAAVNKEIRDFRDKYSTDVTHMKSELQALRQEVDLMRFERDEAQARLPDSPGSDMTLFARQITAMRSELDKLAGAFRHFQKDGTTKP